VKANGKLTPAAPRTVEQLERELEVRTTALAEATAAADAATAQFDEVGDEASLDGASRANLVKGRAQRLVEQARAAVVEAKAAKASEDRAAVNAELSRLLASLAPAAVAPQFAPHVARFKEIDVLLDGAALEGARTVVALHSQHARAAEMASTLGRSHELPTKVTLADLRLAIQVELTAARRAEKRQSVDAWLRDADLTWQRNGASAAERGAVEAHEARERKNEADASNFAVGLAVRNAVQPKSTEQ
jgi:hypothetical protein